VFSRTVAHGAQEQHEAKHGLAVAVDRLATKPIGETRAQKTCSTVVSFCVAFLVSEQRKKEMANAYLLRVVCVLWFCIVSHLRSGSARSPRRLSHAMLCTLCIILLVKQPVRCPKLVWVKVCCTFKCSTPDMIRATCNLRNNSPCMERKKRHPSIVQNGEGEAI
jgi:hypothetical protein